MGIKYIVGDTSNDVITDNILFLIGLIPLTIGIPLFTTTPFTKEKVNGVMSSLLSTKLTPDDICLGKSLAIFIPGLLISYLSMFIFTIGLIIRHQISIPLICTVFIMMPLFFLGLSIWTVQLSMLNSPELAIAPSYLIGLALFIGIPMLSVMQIITLQSWYFFRIALIVTASMWILVVVFKQALTKEKIILSK
ncbi:hypothetical protein [Cellulosilyticum ruminicola]|uniref:hypothetical protein n=1 Tax=Cellulosilyticum ruminicola TaxID=425254 RepID=UPI0006D156D0|nr:hypothetical protein [Cellulosilyticum ruminicola]